MNLTSPSWALGMVAAAWLDKKPGLVPQLAMGHFNLVNVLRGVQGWHCRLSTAASSGCRFLAAARFGRHSSIPRDALARDRSQTAPSCFYRHAIRRAQGPARAGPLACRADEQSERWVCAPSGRVPALSTVCSKRRTSGRQPWHSARRGGGPGGGAAVSGRRPSAAV